MNAKDEAMVLEELIQTLSDKENHPTDSIRKSKSSVKHDTVNASKENSKNKELHVDAV